jgi:hypothetical protein
MLLSLKNWIALVIVSVLFCQNAVNSFNLVLMGARRGKGDLKRSLDSSDKPTKKGKDAVKSLNRGRGQEITGVTLPADGR